MDGMTWMTGAMHAAQAQLATAAHNLANVTSDGFRRVRSSLAFSERGLVATEATSSAQGGIRETKRSLDLALLGPGAFDVGGRPTRDGAFVRDRDGYLAAANGDRLRGMHGAIRTSSADVSVDADGTVRERGRLLDRLRLPAGTSVRSGALESSNVDAIGETLAILNAQRAFETAQKTLVAIDTAREKAVNDVVRLK